jgi:peptide-N4-(N-acetyl-beta-glucosaminyl)asparagine amidase
MNRKILLAGACLLASMPATLSAQITYESFTSLQGIVPVGSAIQQKDVIRLTPDKPWVAGAIWSTDRVRVADGFTTEFTFRITAPGGASGDPNRDGGADGLAFVIQNSSPAALGDIGHQIGYGGIPNSLAIELDTWNNAPMGNGDPNNNHISVQSAGKEPNSYDHKYSLGVAENIPKLDDGKSHTLRVDYLPGHMTIAIDGTEVLDAELDLSTIISIEDGSAWVGFTSATARAWENHDLLSWSFSPSIKSVPTVVPEISENVIAPPSATDPVGESTSSPGGLARRSAITGAVAPMSIALTPNPTVVR